MQSFKFLNQEELSLIRQKFTEFIWEDGKNTAKGLAREIKNNRQVSSNSQAMQPVIGIFTREIFASPIKDYVFPKNLISIRANSYSKGESYDWHVDSAHLDQKRTDISFTLFISDPDDYDGGELELNDKGRLISVKLDAGSIFFYSTGMLHRVKEIRHGTRHCIVGWVESLVPEDLSREILADFRSVVIEIQSALVKDMAPARQVYDKASQIYAQLVRTLSR